MKRLSGLVLPLCLLFSPVSLAFCGFYVAKADTSLFNRASEVAIVRDGKRTVLTMSNDFRGNVREFAMVIPVPTVLEREQINVGERALLTHLDAYTAPRLVEYFDADPCRRLVMMERAAPVSPAPSMDRSSPERAKSLGVTIEAQYAVGEYDILILSAQQSDGLVTWLRESGYRLPTGAEPTIGSYLRQGNRFFVARVNLERQTALGFTTLRPLQLAFETDKFMLPIRLGTLNADGQQELFIYTLTRTGRVETTNYRTVKLPTGQTIPGFVKPRFGEFYKSMFRQQVARENGRAVFLEYAWDMGWCDPCAADPLSGEELRRLGVFWLRPGRDLRRGADVYVTRLHLRYDADTFPEDLKFQQTGDRKNFQGRYVIQNPFKGPFECPEGRRYVEVDLPARRQREARTLANLTGWPLSDIQAQMQLVSGGGEQAGTPWWRQLWK